MTALFSKSNDQPEGDSPSDNLTRVHVTVENSLGLHARPAAMFVQLASKYEGCKVRVARVEEEPVDGKSIMGLMMLAAAKGTQLYIEVEGPSSKDIAEELGKLIESRFNEEDPEG